MYQNNYRGSVNISPTRNPHLSESLLFVGTKKVFTEEKGLFPTGMVQLLVWDTNVAAVSFSWDTKNSRRKVEWKQSIHVIDVNFGA